MKIFKQNYGKLNALVHTFFSDCLVSLMTMAFVYGADELVFKGKCFNVCRM